MNTRLCPLYRSPIWYMTKLRCFASYNPREFETIVEKWPQETCGRQMSLRGLLIERAKEVAQNPNSPWCAQSECESWFRILGNQSRDRYSIPRGLGQGTYDPNAPGIAASGATLFECRRILAEQNELAKNPSNSWANIMRPYFTKKETSDE